MGNFEVITPAGSGTKPTCTGRPAPCALIIDCHLHLNHYTTGRIPPAESVRRLREDMAASGVDHVEFVDPLDLEDLEEEHPRMLMGENAREWFRLDKTEKRRAS